MDWLRVSDCHQKDQEHLKSNQGKKRCALKPGAIALSEELSVATRGHTGSEEMSSNWKSKRRSYSKTLRKSCQLFDRMFSAEIGKNDEFLLFLMSELAVMLQSELRKSN